MRITVRTVLVLALVSTLTGVAPGWGSETSCDDPATAWTVRSPEEVGFDPVRLQEALDWATLHTSFSVAVVRHGCLVATSRLDPVTGDLALNGWSMTKSVTAMLVGRAVTLGLLDIDEPIVGLYPEADGAHRSLTLRHLLTMTSGLHRNWLRDIHTLVPDRIRDTLSLPFDHEPGTMWQYAQSPVSLALDAVGRASGMDVEDFAHTELFAPIGIDRDVWRWDRDRAGHTEGWAHLHMRATDWARLGHLMLRNGSWNGRRLISEDYIAEATTPVEPNGAYGLLFWLNGGDGYVLPEVEGRDEGEGWLIPYAPADTYVMAGNLEQRTYTIPSRDMVVVRLGDRGSREGDTRTSVWTGRGGELDNELMRRIMLAVTDVPYTDPGPYRASGPRVPTPQDGIVGDALDPEHVLAGVGAGPRAPEGCSPAGCD